MKDINLMLVGSVLILMGVTWLIAYGAGREFGREEMAQAWRKSTPPESVHTGGGKGSGPIVPEERYP